MSIVGTFTIPVEAFSLERALSSVPAMRVEADRLASHSPQEVFPFLWARGGDFDAFERALADDPTVTDVSNADTAQDEVLYRLKWSQEFCELIHEMVDHHAAIVEATAQDDEWRLRLRFANEPRISEFQTHFRERDHEFTVHNLAHPTEPRQRTFGLTAEQYESLVVAVREGYFRVPRETTVEALGDRLGVSANAASERLRRGMDALVREALSIPDEETND